MPKLSDRVNTFTDSVIRRMTRISDEYGAINLSQGFPDLLRNRERLSDARSIRRRRLWLPAAAQKL